MEIEYEVTNGPHLEDSWLFKTNPGPMRYWRRVGKRFVLMPRALNPIWRWRHRADELKRARSARWHDRTNAERAARFGGLE